MVIDLVFYFGVCVFVYLENVCVCHLGAYQYLIIVIGVLGIVTHFNNCTLWDVSSPIPNSLIMLMEIRLGKKVQPDGGPTFCALDINA